MGEIRTSTDYIVFHVSATRADQDIGVAEIDVWHRARGWDGCGYHYVIRRSGEVEKGRPIDQVGAHVQGSNHCSVGVCVVGGLDDVDRPAANFTPEQWRAMAGLALQLTNQYVTALPRGHRDFPDVKKACPCFDVRTWWESTRAVLGMSERAGVG